jgi:putative FmdB family regulatory protein
MEAFQSITAKPLKKCPECGKMKLNRLLGTGAGLIFKGSGFYETDYRSDSYKKGADSEKAKKDTKKSDSKKETKKADKKKSTKSK